MKNLLVLLIFRVCICMDGKMQITATHYYRKWTTIKAHTKISMNRQKGKLTVIEDRSKGAE